MHIHIIIQASDSVSIPGDLGSSYDLTIRVTNTGPSTILNSRVEISFPAQNPQITGSNYFLYPSILSGTPVRMSVLDIHTHILQYISVQKVDAALILKNKKPQYNIIIFCLQSEGTSVNCTDAGLDPMDLVRDGVVVSI